MPLPPDEVGDVPSKVQVDVNGMLQRSHVDELVVSSGRRSLVHRSDKCPPQRRIATIRTNDSFRIWMYAQCLIAIDDGAVDDFSSQSYQGERACNFCFVTRSSWLVMLRKRATGLWLSAHTSVRPTASLLAISCRDIYSNTVLSPMSAFNGCPNFRREKNMKVVARTCPQSKAIILRTIAIAEGQRNAGTLRAAVSARVGGAGMEGLK